jgi:hypothetical protein
MKPSEITKIIERELDGNWSPEQNPHGVDLKKCLLMPPLKQVFKDSFQDNKDVKMWLVLEEDPEGKNGYKIIFEEETRKFGLATKNRIFIGFYGDLLTTLACM